MMTVVLYAVLRFQRLSKCDNCLIKLISENKEIEQNFLL